MITVCADASGNILQIVSDPHLEAPIAAGPQGTASVVPLDERTNVALLSDLFANPGSYTVSGSTLLHSGSPAVVNPPSLARLDRLALIGIWNTLKADNPLTAVQTRQLLRMLVRLLIQSET